MFSFVLSRNHFKAKFFFCDICSEGYFNADNLQAHLMKHAGVRVSCYVPGCDFSATSRSNLLAHIKLRHKLTPEEHAEFFKKLDAFDKEMKIKFPCVRESKKND